MEERELTRCALGNNKKFTWAQARDGHWEERTLHSTEQHAGELQEAYTRLAYVVQYVCGFRDNARAVAERTEITSVSIEYTDAAGEVIRFITIKANVYMPLIGARVKVTLPRLNELFTDTFIAGMTFGKILNELEKECFKYIDGYRAQTQLQFERAEEMAEAAKEDVG